MRQNQAGITLLEVLAVTVIMGLLVSFAIPSVRTMVERSDLNEAMQRLRTDISLARSEAVRRDRIVTMSFQTGANSCWGINELIACNCNAANSCGVKVTDDNDADFLDDTWRELRVTAASLGNVTIDAGNVTVGPAPGNYVIKFEPTGTVTDSGYIELDTPSMNGRIQVNPIGRTKLCSDSINGLPATATCN